MAFMNNKEIALWFDKAYANISAGDFAGATTAFEYIIENFDAYAATIAEQRLRWYCVPLQGVFERIQQSSLPVNIHEILIELFHLVRQSHETDFQLTFQEIERGLSGITSCIRVGEKCWIRKDAFNEMIQFSGDSIQKNSGLVILDDLIKEKWAGSDNLNWGLPDYFTINVFADSLSKQEIHVLAQGKWYISKLGAVAAVEAFAGFIRNSKRPINIKDFLIEHFSLNWYASDVESFFKRCLDARFVEVASGYEFLVEFLNLEDSTLDNYFQPNFMPISTSDLLSKILFPNSNHPPGLTSKVLKLSTKGLARNPNIYQLGDGHWIQARLIQQLVSQANEFLKDQHGPLNTTDILQYGTTINQGSDEIPTIVIDYLKSEFRRSPSFIDLGNDQWMHVDTLRRLGDSIYKFLLDSSVPLSIRELIQKLANLNRVLSVDTLADALEKIFLGDDRVFGEKKGGVIYWQINNPTRRYFDQCYQILLRCRLPLTLTELISTLPNEFQTEISKGDLTTDPRFTLFPGDKWGLTHWVWLNELAFEYIAKTRQNYHANVLIGLVCKQNQISEKDAIFIPEEDSRFVKDSINRWGILYRLKDTEINLIHDELVKYLGIGSSLGNILNRIVHLPVHMTNAHDALTRDNRFICLDGKWFVRQVAFYQLMESDLNLIYEFLVILPAEQLPVSIDILIRESLGRDSRLTDATDKLKLDARFFEYYEGFWAFTGFTIPEIVRNSLPFTTGHGKSKKDILILDEENKLPAELTSRKNHQVNERYSADDIKKAYIVLSHLDILHGNLRVYGTLKHMISDEQNAVHFIDDEKFEFVSPLDETRSILHIRPWLEKRRLTFGDKISVQVDEREGLLLIRPYGERDQRVYQEAIQHQDIERLIEEARQVDKTYHDLIIEVLDTLPGPLHREDIFQLVDYQRTASRSTIFEILSLVDCPYEELRYFVPSGKGYWSFDRRRKEVYDMKMQELEQQNSNLLVQVGTLSAQLENQETLIANSAKLQFDQQIQLLEDKNSRLESERNQVEKINRELHQEIVDLGKRLTEQFSSQLNQLQAQNKDLAESIAILSENKDALESTINVLNSKKTELQESLIQYQAKEEQWKSRSGSLESDLARLQTEYKATREQLNLFAENLEEERKSKLLIVDDSRMAIEDIQEKLNSSYVDLEQSRQELVKYKERLDKVYLAFNSPLGRLIARFLHIDSKGMQKES